MTIPMSMIGAAIGEWLEHRRDWVFQPPHDDAAGRRGGICPHCAAQRSGDADSLASVAA